MLLSVLLTPAAAQLSDSVAMALRMEFAKAGYREVVLERSQGGVLTAPSMLDTARVRLLIDPKSPLTFLDREAVVALGFSPRATDVDINFGGASEPLYSLVVPSMTIGQLQLDSIRFDVTRIAHVARAAGLGEEDDVAGLIGRDFLLRCSAMMDLAENRLLICQPAPEPVADTTVADSADSNNLLKNIGDKLRKREERNRNRDRNRDTTR